MSHGAARGRFRGTDPGIGSPSAPASAAAAARRFAAQSPPCAFRALRVRFVSCADAADRDAVDVRDRVARTLGTLRRLTSPSLLSITMALVEPELFIKIFCAVMGMYGLQMLAVPAKMVTDHFDAPATPLLQFWIRGSSCAFLTIVYLVKFKLATEDAVPSPWP